MAINHENGKGFLIIRTESLYESMEVGGIPICGRCFRSSYTGYYIAVLDAFFCDECFDNWYNSAERDPANMDIEKLRYDRYAKDFGIKKMDVTPVSIRQARIDLSDYKLYMRNFENENIHTKRRFSEIKMPSFKEMFGYEIVFHENESVEFIGERFDI